MIYPDNLYLRLRRTGKISNSKNCESWSDLEICWIKIEKLDVFHSKKSQLVVYWVYKPTKYLNIYTIFMCMDILFRIKCVLIYLFMILWYLYLHKIWWRSIFLCVILWGLLSLCMMYNILLINMCDLMPINRISQ